MPEWTFGMSVRDIENDATASVEALTELSDFYLFISFFPNGMMSNVNLLPSPFNKVTLLILTVPNVLFFLKASQT